MEETVKAYLAGVIDGEGSISITKQTLSGRHKAPVYQSVLTVAMSTEEPLKSIQEWFGGSPVWVDNKVRPGRVKLMRMWRVSGRKATEVLESIFPYLILKKPQASIAIAFRKVWDIHPSYGRAGVPQDILDMREMIYQHMKELNK